MQTRQIETIHVLHTRQDKIKLSPSPADKKSSNYPCAQYKTRENKTIPLTLLDPRTKKISVTINSAILLPSHADNQDSVELIYHRLPLPASGSPDAGPIGERLPI